MRPLTFEDFPLLAMGQIVYRRNGEVLLSVNSPQLAADIAWRLNRDDTCGFGYYKSSGELVYG